MNDQAEPETVARPTAADAPGAFTLHRHDARIFRHLDRQRASDDRHARHLFGLGEGAAPALFLRQYLAGRRSFDYHARPVRS